jgi:TonB family protein
MFETYVYEKKRKLPSWTRGLLIVSVVLHAGAGAGLAVYSWMKIDKIETPDTGVKVGLDLPPPPPPPKGTRSQKLEAKKDPTPRKVKPVDTVQPEKRLDKQDDRPSSDATSEVEGDPDGEEGGVEGGVVGGQVGGVIGGVVSGPPPPPPPPPPKVETITPQALEAQRISGEKNIVPDDVTKTEIQRSGKNRLVVPVKLCVNEGGRVTSVNVMKSSGFTAYDNKIKREMQTWKYRPFMVNNKAAPVCTAITLIYVQKG